MFKAPRGLGVEPVPATRKPPTVEEIFNSASAASAYAEMALRDLLVELVDANARLDDVEMRTTSEIERLTQLRAEAIGQRKRNVALAESVAELAGENRNSTR